MVTAEQIKDLKSRLDILEKVLRIAERRQQVDEMAAQSQAPGFWDDPKAAEAFLKKASGVKVWVSDFEAACSAAADVDVLQELEPEGEDIDKAFAQALAKVEDL